jgi:hypothetical protein
LRQAKSKGANPYVGDIIDEVKEKVQAVVVMFSPDDLVQLKERFLHAEDRATEAKAPRGLRVTVHSTTERLRLLAPVD